MMADRDDELRGDDPSLVRHEDELVVGTREVPAGSIGARKEVETETVDQLVPREREFFDEVERTRPHENDSGEIETLPDGSVSIPILEEELVVTKRTVVRERVLIRKGTVTEEERVSAELRKERIEIDVDPTIHDRVDQDELHRRGNEG